jgi:hypothetical protein
MPKQTATATMKGTRMRGRPHKRRRDKDKEGLSENNEQAANGQRLLGM